MTNPSHTELAARLRETAQSIRRKPMPLADFIPLLQQAADALESPERVQGEAIVFTPPSDCDSQELCKVNRRCAGRYNTKAICPTPPTAPAQDVHAQRNAQTLVDIGNAALRAGWNGVDMKAFVLARLATPSPQATNAPLYDPTDVAFRSRPKQIEAKPDTDDESERWTYLTTLAPDGWYVSAHDNRGNSYPMIHYPNAYKAAARLLQLMEITHPVTPQNWPERVGLGGDHE